jgi:hypothetical protein
MHSVLFWVDPGERQPKWREFDSLVATKVQACEHVLRLSENVWLLDLTKSVLELGWLIALSDRHGLPYRILPFQQKPEWLPDGSYPKTT